SRLIVKNLPKHYNADRFREHFGQKGEVTDVKLVQTKDGQFRRFGYVGFKTEKEAKAALKHFNGTYIDTSKIIVDFAKAIGDATLPRPWSRYSQGSSANTAAQQAAADAAKKREERQEKIKQSRAQAEKEVKQKQEHLSELLHADESDPKLKEFLTVMRAGKKGPTWTNDSTVGDAVDGRGPKKAKAQTVVAAVPNKKPGGDGLLVTRAHVKFGGEEDDDEYEDLPAMKKEKTEEKGQGKEDDEEDEEDIAEGQQKSVAFDSGLSDMDYLRLKMKKLDEGQPDHADVEKMDVDEEREIAEESTEIADASPKDSTAPLTESLVDIPTAVAPSDPKDMPPAELIADTGRLYVRNLPYVCTVEDLRKLFEKFGPLSEVHIPIDKETKKSKGYAFILFLLPEHAVKAFTKLDGTIFQGRILEILPGKDKPRVEAEEDAQGSYRSKKEKQKKATAGNEFSWNSLFMNSDTVAEAMADKLGVRKADILDRESENMAVRLALAETHIIAETKQYLEEEGINLDAFEKRKTRSNTILLVKNLPARTEEDELVELFGKFGSLGRVVLPPAKTIALVEYLEPNEAKSAFTRLAYTKFKHLPLYLEWAPVGTFKSAFDPAEAEERKKRRAETGGKRGIRGGADAIADEIAPNGETPPEEDTDMMPVATLFVKNLNFDTKEETLKSAFEGVGGLRSVRIATKPDKRTGEKLSMGFGFLEFATKEDAMRCMKSMQNFKVDGHALNLKFSNAAAKTATSAGSRKRGADDPVKITGSKLVVRNVPFEATKKDIRQLFSTFGQIKSVRLPRKFDGAHRGFAFVDFLTKQEAKTAFESLGATHLYGRHLVLEWAEEEQDEVEVAREKTKKAFFKDGGMPGKRRKIEMGEEGDDFIPLEEDD
ncbi:hypothetical protein HK104_001596, partial [Borealophlyctis nickersoniae]